MHESTRSTTLGAWLLAPLLTLTAAGAVMAADADAEGKAEPEETAQANGNGAPAADEAGNTGADGGNTGADKEAREGETPGVFVPSEEISEDFAVSFPVDI